MKISKEKKFIQIKFNLNENISNEDLEKVKIKENDTNTRLAKIQDNILGVYEKAKNNKEFDINFYLYWYSFHKQRFEITEIIINFLKYYGIKLPEYLIFDLNLYKVETKFKKNQINLQKNENIKSKKYLHKIVNIGNSRLEVYGKKPKNLKKELEDELKSKKEASAFIKIQNRALKILNRSKSYRQYLVNIKPLYLKLYELTKNLNTFELYRGQLTYGLPKKIKEWLNEIPNIPMMVFQTKNPIPIVEHQAYLREDELFEKYKNEKYIIKPLIFNSNYPIDKREKLFLDSLSLLKKNEALYEFVSNSIEKQVKGLLNHDKELERALVIFKEERLIVYRELVKEIKNSALFKSLSKSQKNELEKINEKLINVKLGFIFYYQDYQNIKSEIDNDMFNDEERDFSNKLGIDNFRVWKYAFYVLVYRNRNNKHFLGCFDNKSQLNLNDKQSLEDNYEKFHNAYNQYRHQKTKKL